MPRSLCSQLRCGCAVVVRAKTQAWLVLVAFAMCCQTTYAQSPLTAREIGQSVGSYSARATPGLQTPESQLRREMGLRAGDRAGGRGSESEYDWDEQSVSYLVQQRKFHVTGGLSAGWQYDDNLSISDTNAQESAMVVVEPRVDLQYGPLKSGISAALDYGASLQWYLDRDNDLSVNHHAGLSVSWTGARLHATLGVGYSSTDGANIDVGDRVQGNTMAAMLNVGYDYSPKTTFGATIGTEILDYSGEYFNSKNYSSTVYVDYSMTAKTNVGLQLGCNNYDVTEGSSSLGYNASLRMRWAATDKFGIHGSVGAESRDYADGGSDVHPIFDLGIDGDLFSTGSGRTSFGVSTYSGYHDSAALRNQGYYSIGVMAHIRQEWSEKLAFALNFGYDFSDYLSTSDETNASRRDNYYYIRPNLTYAFSHRLSFSMFYQYSTNDSQGFGASSYSRSYYGVMANLAF